MKRGTEDLDFFIGDEALTASAGPGYGIHYPIRHGQIDNWVCGIYSADSNLG
jgi:actin-related protein 3